jgi:hypothetical protein
MVERTLGQRGRDTIDTIVTTWCNRWARTPAAVVNRTVRDSNATPSLAE